MERKEALRDNNGSGDPDLMSAKFFWAWHRSREGGAQRQTNQDQMKLRGKPFHKMKELIVGISNYLLDF